MKKRLLRDIAVSAVGVGCMGFSHGYGAGPDRVRRVITRFDNRNIEANQPLLDLLYRFADEKGVTLAQVSRHTRADRTLSDHSPKLRRAAACRACRRRGRRGRR
jgi:aryl-alcohol dehydrogenase-like predicted oxidoreductase